MTFLVAQFNETNPTFRLRVDSTARKLGASGVVQIRDVEELRTLQAELPECVFVPLELSPDAVPLSTYGHPEYVVYVVGPDLGTIPVPALRLMDPPVYIESPGGKRILSTPVVTGIVLYHRLMQQSVVAA